MAQVNITPEECDAIFTLLQFAKDETKLRQILGRDRVAEAIPIVENFHTGIDDMVHEQG